jgi:cytochrome c peroxidase
MTYPYFHDGAANTLTEAVDVMGRIQLGKNFTKRRKRQDRRLPEDADRRPAELRAADPAALVRQDAAADALLQVIASSRSIRAPL